MTEKTENVKYYEFIEHNDNEGETWSFFIPLTDPQLEDFIKIVKKSEELFVDDEYPYEFYPDSHLNEEEVNLIIVYSHSGYNPSHMKVHDVNWDYVNDLSEDLDVFYKGRCFIL